MNKTMTLHVRMDDDSERQLAELVEHFRAKWPIGTVTASDVLRAALREMYERDIVKPTRKPRKAPADAT